MPRKQDVVEEENENIRINNDIITHPDFFNFVLSVMNSDNEVDTDALTASFDESCVRTRKQGGKELKYIPSKFVKERLNESLDCKWSFFPIHEERVSDPLPRYNRDEDTYVDSDNYIKVTGCLVIMGLGVQVATGVKRTYGYGEADDWKAAATDAFKKCCSMFGIEADYEIEDNVDSDGPASNIDLDDVEYDDDELNEALETQVTFGKFKNLTLDEIYDEDPSYIEWLVENAREEDMQMNAAIVLKYYTEQNSKKKSSSKSSSKKKSGSKSSSSSGRKSSSKSSSTRKSSGKKSSTRSKAEEEDEDEEVDDARSELIENIEEIFEEEGYDAVTKKQIIQSVSASKKNPRGKSKLSDLTEKELSALLEVLVEDEDEEEDE